jgi:hypothetical protein
LDSRQKIYRRVYEKHRFLWLGLAAALALLAMRWLLSSRHGREKTGPEDITWGEE